MTGNVSVFSQRDSTYMEHGKSRFGMQLVRVLYAALGLSVGVVGTAMVTPGVREACIPVSAQPAVAPVSVAPGHDACADTLQASTQRIAALERELAAARATAPVVMNAPKQPEDGSVANGADQGQASNASRWRISAIEKFVPLTEEQRERLKTKYEREAEVGASEAETETLEEIIGDENARFYRDQVKAAFQKVQDEEVDKEVVWLARQLSLTREQEQSMQQVFLAIERQLADEGSVTPHAAKSPAERVKALVAENRKRSELRAEQLKSVLSADQYQAYVRSQAESSSADVEVFHDPQ